MLREGTVPNFMMNLTLATISPLASGNSSSTFEAGPGVGSSRNGYLRLGCALVVSCVRRTKAMLAK